MAVDILTAIREQRLSTVKRSMVSSENNEKRVGNLATRTAAMLNGGVPGGQTEHLEEYVAREAYTSILEEYTRKPSYCRGQPFTPRGLALWRRVAAAIRTSGVDHNTFIRAQFTWFHNAFRTAPSPLQLATDAAIVRAASVVLETVRTNTIEAQIPLGDLFKRCEKQMMDLMRAQNLSRLEVYRTLVRPGIVAFPDKFLNADPVWKQV